jgi:hypothetical protein
VRITSYCGRPGGLTCMSLISSQASAVSASDSNGPGCEPSRSARSTDIAGTCSPSTGPTCHAMTTSQPASSEKARPTSSAAGFLAKTSATRASAPDLPASVRDSGGNCFEPFAWYDLGTLSWRTWQRCLLEGWTLFSETWPRSGMTRNGIAYRRAPLVRLTDEIGSGLLPTPRAEGMDAMGSGTHAKDSLVLQSRQWPTPTARDWKGTPLSLDTLPTNSRPLNEAVRARRWPTPTSNDCKPAGQSEVLEYRQENRRTTAQRLRAAATEPSEIGGSLNPTWVEWLMGFPLGWTGLDRSATPSSRKSRKSSGALSCESTAPCKSSRGNMLTGKQRYRQIKVKARILSGRHMRQFLAGEIDVCPCLMDTLDELIEREFDRLPELIAATD